MPKSVEKCVKKVKQRKEARDAWAICQEANKKKFKGRGVNHASPRRAGGRKR